MVSVSHRWVRRYGWLFAPPGQINNRKCTAEIDWERLGRPVSFTLLVALVLTGVAAKLEGRQADSA